MLQKNDFIELEFIGRVKDGDIFDTNIKEEAKKINLDIDSRPLVICLGQGMILPSIDNFLIGKDIGKFELPLAPEKSFGYRDTKMIKIMPLKIFHEKQVIPQPGMVFQFDDLLGKVSAVSGGRVIVDFNNPLAGKDVVYSLNLKRKIEKTEEKVECLMLFWFRRKFDFEIKDSKLVIKADSKLKAFFEIFKEKFKEILNLELEFQAAEEKKQLEQKIETKDEKSDKNNSSSEMLLK